MRLCNSELCQSLKGGGADRYASCELDIWNVNVREAYGHQNISEMRDDWSTVACRTQNLQSVKMSAFSELGMHVTGSTVKTRVHHKNGKGIAVH